MRNPSITAFVQRKLSGDRKSLRALLATTQDIAVFNVIWHGLVNDERADPAIAAAIRPHFTEALARIGHDPDNLEHALLLSTMLAEGCEGGPRFIPGDSGPMGHTVRPGSRPADRPQPAAFPNCPQRSFSLEWPPAWRYRAPWPSPRRRAAK